MITCRAKLGEGLGSIAPKFQAFLQKHSKKKKKLSFTLNVFYFFSFSPLNFLFFNLTSQNLKAGSALITRA
jgi:hypothetical protein